MKTEGKSLSHFSLKLEEAEVLAGYRALPPADKARMRAALQERLAENRAANPTGSNRKTNEPEPINRPPRKGV